MAFAQGRASLWLTKDIGATDLGRWQVWQCFCRMGETSLLNVSTASAALAAPAHTTETTSSRAIIDNLALNGLLRAGSPAHDFAPSSSVRPSADFSVWSKRHPQTCLSSRVRLSRR